MMIHCDIRTTPIVPKNITYIGSFNFSNLYIGISTNCVMKLHRHFVKDPTVYRSLIDDDNDDNGDDDDDDPFCKVVELYIMPFLTFSSSSFLIIILPPVTKLFSVLLLLVNDLSIFILWFRVQSYSMAMVNNV